MDNKEVLVEVCYRILTEGCNADEYELLFPYFKDCGVQELTAGDLSDQYPDACARDFCSLIFYSMYREGLLGFFNDPYMDDLEKDETLYVCRLTAEDFGKVQVVGSVDDIVDLGEDPDDAD